jgi:hypothetical protein
MSLVVCAACKMNTLVVEGKCQNCGNPFKQTIWNRKLRKREAYGVLIIVIGFAAIRWFHGIGFLLLLVGAGLIIYGFLKPRVR